MAHGRRAEEGHRRIWSWRVLKKIPYGHQRIDPRDIDAVVSVLKSDWLTTGPQVEAFESELAAYCGARHAIAVSSGTAALYGACDALGLAPGTEGIVPSLTFAASATCLLHANAKPVFIDIDTATGNLDPAAVEAAISSETRVIVPAHFAGLPANLDALAEIADRHHVAILEDGAHALGASIGPDKVGGCAKSQVTIFSFHPVKAITTGEGGAVLTNDDHLAERVRAWRNHGIRRYPAHDAWYYEIDSLGENARLTDFACALGRAQLATLDVRISERQGIAAAYDRLLEPFSDRVLRPPRPPDGTRHAWHLYVIRFTDPTVRATVYREMQAAGIGVQVHYIPAHWHPVFKAAGAPPKGSLPHAEDWYESSLSLPIYPGLTYDDQVRVISVLKRSLEIAAQESR